MSRRIKYDPKKILPLLSNYYPSGNKGWYTADCPYCGKKEHFGIIFNDNGPSSFNCWKCHEKGTVYVLLQKLGRLDLAERSSLEFEQLANKIDVFEENDGIDIKIPKEYPPLGYRQIHHHEYLDSRGLVNYQYKEYPVGITKLDHKLKDYIIFLIYRDNECKGWIARSTKTSKEIDDINREIEEYNKTAESLGLKKKKKYLRYINSTNTDFGKLLYGFDDIVAGKTETVILVEGIFGKHNTDKLLNLSEVVEEKCCATFGKKITPYQIALLQSKGVKNILLIYDPDAVNESKRYAVDLYKYFDVKVGFTTGSKDPGDININELNEIIIKSENPLLFKINKVQKQIL